MSALRARPRPRVPRTTSSADIDASTSPAAGPPKACTARTRDRASGRPGHVDGPPTSVSATISSGGLRGRRA